MPRKPKEWPLAIEEPLIDMEGFYSKGWHDKTEFIEALNKELVDEGELGWCCHDPIPPERAKDVRHEYWRNGQDAWARMEEWGFSLYTYKEPGPGRYKATVLYPYETYPCSCPMCTVSNE